MLLVVPSARAVNFTMNRKAIRDLAAKELGLKTAKYFYAKSLEELQEAANEIGFPCVLKPLMSSSGKGRNTVLLCSVRLSDMYRKGEIIGKVSSRRTLIPNI